MILFQFTSPDAVSDERLDMSYLLGMTAWRAFQKSPIGEALIGLLPSGTARRRAYELFLLGFTARMSVFTPYGVPELDELVDLPLIDIVWEDYLISVKGAVVLDGPPYPDTPKETLALATTFFRLGFQSGTFAYNELAKD